VNKAYSRERANLTRSLDREPYLATFYGVPVAGITLWILGEELGTPVMGAAADHCGGYACDEAACFGI
jgi:hypothetical protein